MTKARDLAGFASSSVTTTASDGLVLKGDGSSTDVVIKNDADATVFTVPTGTDDILFPDNAKAMFGAGSDLQIYHEGNYSIISDTGTGNLLLTTNGGEVQILGQGGGEASAKFIQDGSVELYYDNAKKLETTATGINVTGTVSATAFTGDGSGLTGLGGGVPAGSVIYHAANTAPTGFLKANGAAISRSTYSDLFTAIGTTFGVGDGSSTFNVPDLRGEFARGWDDSRGIDSGRSFGSAQADELKSHNHSINVRYSATFNGGHVSANSLGGNSQNLGSSIASTGGSETRPRNIALLACIKY